MHSFKLLSSFPRMTYWWDCLPPIVYSYLLCCGLIDHRWVGLFLGFLSYSFELYFCFLLPVSYSLDGCSFVVLAWSQGAWFRQLCFSFSRLLWLFRVFRVSTQFFFFFNFWLCWVFGAAHGLSLVVASRCFSLVVWGPLTAVASLAKHELWAPSCSTWAQQLWLPGPRTQAQQLRHVVLVAPWRAGSSWSRGGTCVPCIGRWS